MNHRPPSGTGLLIADAAIRVIARDGFDEISVRTVATEAKLAAGTVQHHFHNRDALLTGALNRVMERQLQRIVRMVPLDDPASSLRRSIEELMPFDATRRDEAIVWLVLSAAAPSRPSLQTPHTAGIDLIRYLIRNALVGARDRGIFRDDLDPDTETVLLAATVDGLLMHALSTEPSAWPLIVSALDSAIDRLFVEGRPGAR